MCRYLIGEKRAHKIEFENASSNNISYNCFWSLVDSFAVCSLLVLCTDEYLQASIHNEVFLSSSPVELFRSDACKLTSGDNEEANDTVISVMVDNEEDDDTEILPV